MLYWVCELKITSRTGFYAIIGNPIKHSLSPVIQNEAFKSTGIDAVYLAFQVESSVLSEAIDGFRAFNIFGFNVTIPHKVAVMKYLDELDESSTTIGATNTVVNREGRLIGYNTDGTGALAALQEAGVDPQGKRILLIGAGGAARALAFSFAGIADRLTILNRTVSKAEDLAKEVRRVTGMPVFCGELDSSTLNEEMAYVDLLVNATSVGMNPQPNETLVDASLLRRDMTVFDIVYSPLQTRLLREAKEAGAKIVDGLAMLVHQGAQAFELWTGKKAPVLAMTKALKMALGVES
jgi:shikimate dehydrogenase